MDALDSSLYSQVLSSLAANIATSSKDHRIEQDDDVQLLTQPLSDLPLPRSASTSHTQNGDDQQDDDDSLVSPLSLSLFSLSATFDVGTSN